VQKRVRVQYKRDVPFIQGRVDKGRQRGPHKRQETPKLIMAMVDFHTSGSWGGPRIWLLGKEVKLHLYLGEVN